MLVAESIEDDMSSNCSSALGPQDPSEDLSDRVKRKGSAGSTSSDRVRRSGDSDRSAKNTSDVINHASETNAAPNINLISDAPDTRRKLNLDQVLTCQGQDDEDDRNGGL
jgi:hypothetical protein